jgi:hypothetical protein
MKGWPCPADQKPLASQDFRIPERQVTAIRNAISTFTISKSLSKQEDIIPGLDSHYLRVYEPLCRERFRVRYLCHKGVSASFKLKLLTHYISSPPCRAAALVLASYLKNWKNKYETWKYYAAFCIFAKKAIQNENLHELLHASYLLVSYDIISATTSESAVVHFPQFCRVANALVSRETGTSAEEMKLIIGAWRSLVEEFVSERPFAQTVDLLEGLELSLWLLSCRIGGMDTYLGTAPFLVHRVFARVYLENYITCRLNFECTGEDTGSIEINAKTKLNNVLQQIAVDLFHLPDVLELLNRIYDIKYYLQPDWHAPVEADGFLQFPSLMHSREYEFSTESVNAAFISCFAQLLTTFLNPTDTHPTLEAQYSSIAICRLCHYVVGWNDMGWFKRGIFLAALVLRKETYPAGSPKNRLLAHQ